MKTETRKVVKGLLFARIAQQFGLDSIDDVGEYFEITGPQEERINKAIQGRVDFLGKINVIPVTDIQGEKVFSGVQQGITGRVKDGRFRRRIDEDGFKYALAETDSGIIIPWAKLDLWARYKATFLSHYATFVQRQIALDMLMIGWRGITVSANTDIETYPLLQDVNKGWLQWMREHKPENVLAEGKNAGEITIFGEGADYQNLDDLASDLKSGLGDIHRDRRDLVFLVGADLVAKESQLVSKVHGLTPTERAAQRDYDLTMQFGGMRSETPPNFPGRGAVVTTLDNLSIYVQSGSIRRKLKDDDEKKGMIDSYYRNEGYVVEDETCFVGIEFENVVFPEERVSPPATGNVAVASVSVTPETASVAVGGNVQLSVQVLPANATDKTGAWASDDVAVATVTNTGRVTGVAVGDANITFTSTDGSKTDIAAVTVTAN
ncbi:MULTISPECIES: phage major capsid protein, P2 family [Lelliottia]|uniref:Phage major capsid protein, P2 family n=1 Tax=Lelliottia amnigena TaxID=61646 RepID=A0AAP2AI94_LELAM|nr:MULTISPECIES: phage major capsid protein, P2 family [Lelliottia]MBL5884848.1 phage major capsid protein, P2 family [Lelliottia aquatilis]MBL5901435.1 phage major capsid protein, P2 family [Lelliottia amnigena]MBL5936834.1 phage major capsid protein, P2 family [Lelliottia amnigena]